MAKLGSVYIGVRAKTDQYKRDLENAKTLTQKSAVRIQHAISSISFRQVGVAALAFGAIMGKVALDGFKAVEKMKLSTASLAATITSFAKDADTDLAGTYKQAYTYSGQLVERMEELNAKTVATGENLTAMVETMIQGGVILDINNKKQEEGFLAIANALALLTQGQNQDIQFRQEIRGLINGEVKATNALSRILSQLVGGSLKEHVALWKEQGTLIESVGALLGGFQEGAKNLESTWEAIGTTLSTMYNKTLRGLMVPVYEDIIRMGKQITLNALDQNSALNKNAEFLKSVVYKGWVDIKNISASVLDIVLAFEAPLKLIGGLLGLIIDGWGQIFAILPAITNSFKLITQAVFDSVKMVGHFGAALWQAASLDFKGAAELIALAKEDWIESGRKTGEAFGAGFINELDKRLFEYNKNLKTVDVKTVSAPELKKLAAPGSDKEAKAAKKAAEEAFEAMRQARLNGFKEEERMRAEKWQAEIEWSNSRIELEKKVVEANLEIQKEFDQKYKEMGLTRFDLERLQIERMAEIYKKAGVDENKIAQMTSKKNIEIAKKEQMSKLDIYQGIAGGIANTFQMIAQAGGKQSEKAFKIYKAFAMVEAAIAGYKAVIVAMSAYPPPYSFIMAGIAGAAAAVQIGMIAASQPPSFDQGGISNAKGVYQTGNIAEAHIPIPSGGKIPVKMDGGGQGNVVNITMNNPVFQDLATQRQVMSQIAEIVAERVAPGAVVRNYKNDGPVRAMVRGGS